MQSAYTLKIETNHAVRTITVMSSSLIAAFKKSVPLAQEYAKESGKITMSLFPTSVIE